MEIMSSKEDFDMDKFFKYVSKTEEITTDDRTVFIKGVKYHETRQDKKIVDVNDKVWRQVEIIRRIGMTHEGMMSKIVDIYEDGLNVWHKETSPFLDEKELSQFHGTWAKNYNATPPFYGIIKDNHVVSNSK